VKETIRLSLNHLLNTGYCQFLCRQPAHRHRWLRQQWLSLPLLLALSLWMSGCQREHEFDDIYRRVSEPTLAPGMEMPLPDDEPLLTVMGKIGVTNQADTLIMDRTMVEAVGMVTYQVQNPFEGRPITYTGVLMRDLLELWQVDEGVQQVKLVALNDYQVTIPVEDFYTYPILFALLADGEVMEPDYLGPAMLVFPLDHYEFNVPMVRRQWIWQIRAIELL